MAERMAESETTPSSITASLPSNDGPKFIDPIDKYSALIVRGTIVGAGMIGIGLFLKNSRLFARFETVSQIPKDIIRKELELKGRVREILPSGELRIEHEPIIKLPTIFRQKSINQKGLLNVRLAGLDISKAGQQYISKDLRLTNKPVTFTVIKPAEDLPNTIDADVTVKKNFVTRTNLNVDLVRRGYARVPAPDHIKHLKALQSVPAYSRLVSKLLMSEKVADRRGVGVWERDTWVESVQSAPSQFVGYVRAAAITKFAFLMYNVTKDVVLYGVKVAQGTWYMFLTICSYLALGYRKFGQGVDRATSTYNRIKNKATEK
ncbi:unnamed protein product, partial [Mesorhabditis belari]|uniref:Uncharacterized protein n=1 Tax=Mesorhabditis belari TaxID=2138241 RepID=A0AAF3EZB5_9BILA